MCKFFKIYFVSVFIMLFNIQCGLEKDAVLPNSMPYIGNQLRMDGYYYQIAYDDVKYNPYVMYRDGVLITLGGSGSTLDELDNYIRTRIQSARYQKNKYLWKVFFIEDNTIQIYGLWSDYPHRGYHQEGVILNDTTFKITKISYNGIAKEQNEIYHFHQFSPKPDSTNVYIK